MLHICTRNIIELLLPRTCLVCGRSISQGFVCTGCIPEPLSTEVRCIKCFSEIMEPGVCGPCQVFPPLFRSIRFMWSYREEAKQYIVAMKYKPSRKLALFSGRLLSELYIPNPDIELVVPMPISETSFRSRLFNQSEFLAREVAVKRKVPIVLDVLRHRGSRAPQASLLHDKRISNVAKSFYADNKLVDGKRILLVDDVVTTGSTAASAGRELLRKGAKSVDLVSLSRSEYWREWRYRIWAKYRV